MVVTIDEAIEQYKHISKAYDEAGNTDDSAETLQISEWLRQARGAEKAARWYTAKIRELEEENERLRQELAIREESEQEKVIDYLSEQSVDWEDRYRALVSENAKLEKRLAQYGLFREVVGDPAVEFANLRRELHRVERENEKLRELVRDVWDVALHPQLFGDGSYLLRRMCDLGIDAER